jgi:hypothetical protein
VDHDHVPHLGAGGGLLLGAVKAGNGGQPVGGPQEGAAAEDGEDQGEDEQPAAYAAAALGLLAALGAALGELQPVDDVGGFLVALLDEGELLRFVGRVRAAAGGGGRALAGHGRGLGGLGGGDGGLLARSLACVGVVRRIAVVSGLPGLPGVLDLRLLAGAVVVRGAVVVPVVRRGLLGLLRLLVEGTPVLVVTVDLGVLPVRFLSVVVHQCRPSARSSAQVPGGGVGTGRAC